jgi:DsbC/DsbD-like thiol-disulfide interchange protein
MKRRDFVILPFALAFSMPASATEQPWTPRLLKGGFDGTQWWMGFGVKLEPGWKTYWRVPGAGGIAPDIKLSGKNLQTFELLYPVPKATVIELVGTVIGYADEVVFPIRVVPVDQRLPVDLRLESFIGVCKEICIPVQYTTDVMFDPANSNSPDQAEISAWQARVPVLTKDGPVKQVTADMAEGKPRIRLDVPTTFSLGGLFVEGNPLHYFAGPRVLDGKVYFTVNGAKTAEELRKTALRITINNKDGPIEQRLTVE